APRNRKHRAPRNAKHSAKSFGGLGAFSKAHKVFRVESIFRVETYYRDKMYIPFPQECGASARKFWGVGTFSKVPAVFVSLLVLSRPFMRREIENTAPQGCEASG
ncbi:MAG: hypothetical protein KHW46_03465, partial [Clostridiales bacterium]|nr:hypothetical protein [Clostridiales bacterium]